MKAPLLRQGAYKMYAPSMHLMHAPSMHNMPAPPLRPRACFMNASLLKQRRHMACLLTFTMKMTLLPCLRLNQAVHLDKHVCLMHVPLLKLGAHIVCHFTLLKERVNTSD